LGIRNAVAAGRHAEQLAFEHLVKHRLRPVVRNFRRRGGEIDLIMLDESCLVFVEVRYRSTPGFSPASHTVDSRKQRKIIRTAAVFVAANSHLSTRTMRFDVVAIEGHDCATVDWIKDAFRPNDSSL
jgi:putative endonuclease